MAFQPPVMGITNENETSTRQPRKSVDNDRRSAAWRAVRCVAPVSLEPLPGAIQPPGDMFQMVAVVTHAGPAPAPAPAPAARIKVTSDVPSRVTHDRDDVIERAQRGGAQRSPVMTFEVVDEVAKCINEAFVLDG